MSPQINDNGIFVLIHDFEELRSEIAFPENLNLIEAVKSRENVHREQNFFASVFIGFECLFQPLKLRISHWILLLVFVLSWKIQSIKT